MGLEWYTVIPQGVQGRDELGVGTVVPVVQGFFHSSRPHVHELLTLQQPMGRWKMEGSEAETLSFWDIELNVTAAP